jgi:lipopolysaccharide export system permease protein
MPVAERYILRHLVVTTCISLGVILGLVIISQLMIFLQVVTNSSDALATMMAMVAFMTPSLAAVVIPFALLIAICHTFNRMHSDSEIIVLEAAGAPRSLQSRPVLLLAGFLSALMLFNSLVVEPASSRKMRDLIYSSASNIISLAITSGSFHRVQQDLYIQFAGQHPEGGFEGMFIADMREPQSEFIYYASRGRVVSQGDAELLVMSNGEIQRRNARTGEVSTVAFATYALDLADFSPSRGAPNYQAKERSTAEILNPDPDDRVYQLHPHQFRGELHRRLSDWLYPIAFAMTGLFFSVGARSTREEQIWGLTAAVGVAIAFRGGAFLFANDAGRTWLATVMTYALPLSCIFIFGGMLMGGRRARISQRWLDQIAQVTDRIQSIREKGLAAGFRGAGKAAR